jgi:cytochrome P450
MSELSIEREADEGPVASLMDTSDRDTIELHEQLRARGEIFWDQKMNAWLVTSYELAREITRKDVLVWRSPLTPDPENPPFGLDLETYFELQGSKWHPTDLEGADHRRLHRWWMTLLSGAFLRDLQSNTIRPICDQTARELVDRPEVELGVDYADIVSPRLGFGVLGLPWDDADWVARFSKLPARGDALRERQAQGKPEPELVRDAIGAHREMREMLMPIIEARRDQPEEDLVSLLWRSADEMFGGEPYDEHDIAGQMLVLLVGAIDTMSSATSNALYLMLSKPGLQDAVRSGGRSGISGLTEESLRLYGTVSFRPRFAKTDLPIAGVEIKRGETVIVLSNAAGADPDRYEDPLEVRLHRAQPKDHFGFFRGPRQCPGRSLARLELDEIVGALLRQFSSIEPNPDAEPPRFRNLLLRRWGPLHVRLRSSTDHGRASVARPD